MTSLLYSSLVPVLFSLYMKARALPEAVVAVMPAEAVFTNNTQHVYIGRTWTCRPFIQGETPPRSRRRAMGRVCHGFYVKKKGFWCFVVTRIEGIELRSPCIQEEAEKMVRQGECTNEDARCGGVAHV